MNVNFAIGAPSLDGKGAQEQAVAAISGMEFPCSLYVINHMPRPAVFPESGVELASALADSGNVAPVRFASAAVLKRLIRVASEVADLNGYALALSIVDEVPPPITDEELTQQVVEQSPELTVEIEAGGGIDASATLAGPVVDADGKPAGDADSSESGGAQGDTNEAKSDTSAPALSDGVNNNTSSDGNGAGGSATESGSAPPHVVEQAETPKVGGKKKSK